jgi:hypothetical protein
MSGPAFDEPAFCENHADRKAHLVVSLPSIGVMRYMCDECQVAFDTKMAEYKPKLPRWIHDEHMPQWERELRTGNPGETLGMEGREATHRMLTNIAREKPE